MKAIFLFLLALLTQSYLSSSFQGQIKNIRLNDFRRLKHFLSGETNEISDSPPATSKLQILAREMKLTEALEARVHSKIGKVLEKLGKDSISANVVLRIHRYPVTEHHTMTGKKDTHIAEATVRFKGGGVAHASERTDDMYASIDLLSHKLAQAMKKHSEKQRTLRLKKMRNRKAEENENAIEELYDEIEEIEEEKSTTIAEKELDDYLLSELDERYKVALLQPNVAANNQVVRQKVFDMTPITIEDAISAMELLDHPFYVFRNQDGGEINVVYRRRDGGIGHIMPNQGSI